MGRRVPGECLGKNIEKPHILPTFIGHMGSVLNRGNAKSEVAGYRNVALGSRNNDTLAAGYGNVPLGSRNDDTVQVCHRLPGLLNKLPRDL